MRKNFLPRVKYFFLLLMCLPFCAQAGDDDKKDKVRYFDEKSGIRAVAGYQTSFTSNWISLDAELSVIEPLKFVNTRKANGKWKRKLQFASQGTAFAQLGAEYNIENKLPAVRLGLLQRISLLSFNPAQFTYTFGNTIKGITYRPEIGFGFWIFQLNYGYNVNFNKSLNPLGRHLLNVKIHLPF